MEKNTKSKDWIEFYDNYEPPKRHKLRKSDIIHFIEEGDEYIIQGAVVYHIPVTKETWERVYQELQEKS